MDLVKETTIFEKAKSGDQLALLELIDDHKNIIFKSIKIFIKDENVAIDILDDTILYITENIKHCSDELDLKFKFKKKSHELVKEHLVKMDKVKNIKQSLENLSKGLAKKPYLAEIFKDRLSKTDEIPKVPSFSDTNIKNGLRNKMENLLNNKETKNKANIYDIGLEAVGNMSEASYKIITFCFSQILDRDISDNKIQYTKEFIRENKDEILLDLLKKFKREYINKSGIEGEVIDNFLSPLERRMKEKEDNIEVGNKTLKDYLGKDPVEQIVKAVKETNKNYEYNLLKKFYENL